MTNDDQNETEWFHARFGLIVTGKGERQFLPKFFSDLQRSGACFFEVVRRVEQLRPITSSNRKLRIGGKNLPTRDEEIGLIARSYLIRGSHRYVVLIDDLEYDWRQQIDDVFARYRNAFDAVLGPYREDASVHFLVNMLEAYYFADPQAVTDALELTASFPGYNGDVEQIRNPKSELRQQLLAYSIAFDEIEHGDKIVSRLRLERILGNPETCGSLRTLVAWCAERLQDHPHFPNTDWSQTFHLNSGRLSTPARTQLRARKYEGTP